MFETIRQTKVEQIVVFALLGAVGGFSLAAFQESPGESPGDRIVAQAKQENAVIALVGSKDGNRLLTLGVGDGRTAKKCGPGNTCKAKIGPDDSQGKPTLVSTDPNQPLRNLNRHGPMYVFTYESSHCQGSWRGGVHYESCCNWPGC